MTNPMKEPRTAAGRALLDGPLMRGLYSDGIAAIRAVEDEASEQAVREALTDLRERVAGMGVAQHRSFQCPLVEHDAVLALIDDAIAAQKGADE